MTLLAAWVLYPVVAFVLSLGCGLLLERLSGRPLPGPLLAPAGFSLVIVASSLTTVAASTAQATTPLVVALAVAGYGLSVGRWRAPDPWAAGAGLAVFAVYAAPIVLSGAATFAGYVTLDDTSTWLALADNALVHGRDLSQLAPSTYETVLTDYVKNAGYPLGAFLPLGIGHQLTRQDEAWIFQPQIAFLAAMLGLALYALTAGLVRRRPLRAVVAAVGAQAALLYGYAFWSGIKEVTSALLVAVLVALTAPLLRVETRPRELLPLAVAGAALLDVLAVVGVVWFAAFGALAAVLLVSRYRLRALGALTAAAAATALLALPALLEARTFLRKATSNDITQSGAAGLGNLLHPLSNLQVFGIWPTGDFRTRPGAMGVTYALIGIVAVAGVIALIEAARRRSPGLPLLVAVPGLGAAAVVVLGRIGHGSPWLDGKALATASPALLAAGIAGCALLLERGRLRLGVLGGVAGAAIVAGVLWSNGLAYANVWLAPRGQLAELQTIGTRFAGDGPTLMTEYQPYGVRHFLRNLAPEGASERRYRPVLLRGGGELGKSQYADIDAFELGSILVYRTLVLRVSPLASRPPSVYEPVWRGRYYEVWQRPPGAEQILDHLSLGSPLQPDAVAPCAQVESLAALAAVHGGALIASERPSPVVLELAGASRPPAWGVDQSGLIVPHGGGALTAQVNVPEAGVYDVFLGGSFRDTVAIAVDGAPAGTQTDQLSESGQLVPFGSVRLTAGTHTVTISYARDRLLPGEGSYSFGFGPLVLGRPATSARLVAVQPGRARSLCGKSLDWIEAVTTK